MSSYGNWNKYLRKINVKLRYTYEEDHVKTVESGES